VRLAADGQSTCSSWYRAVKVIVTLQPTISRSVRLGGRRPSGTRDQFFFLLEFFFQTVAVRYLVASSLTRGRVCNLLLLLVSTSAVSLLSALSDDRTVLSSIQNIRKYQIYSIFLLTYALATVLEPRVNICFCLNPLLFASCTDTFSKWCKITRSQKFLL
jgi:hypothetical protein